MSGPYHPTGRGRVNPQQPDALAVCERSGFTFNHKDLVWERQWQGTTLVNLRHLVARRFLDVPNPQLRTIILPPDPLPVLNPRPEAYDNEVPSFLMTEGGSAILTETGSALLWQIEDTPNPDPNNPAYYP